MARQNNVKYIFYLVIIGLIVVFWKKIVDFFNKLWSPFGAMLDAGGKIAEALPAAVDNTIQIVANSAPALFPPINILANLTAAAKGRKKFEIMYSISPFNPWWWYEAQTRVKDKILSKSIKDISNNMKANQALITYSKLVVPSIQKALFEGNKDAPKMLWDFLNRPYLNQTTAVSISYMSFLYYQYAVDSNGMRQPIFKYRQWAINKFGESYSDNVAFYKAVSLVYDQMYKLWSVYEKDAPKP